MNTTDSEPALHKKRNPDNLYRRGEIWWIRYGSGGKRIRRSLGTKSVREAKRIRDQILAKRSTAARFGIELAPLEPCKSFAEIATQWLEFRLADSSLAPQTRYQSARIVRSKLLPEFGMMAMSAITVEAIERFIAKLRKNYARSTVANYFCQLRAIFTKSIRWGWFAGPNPLDRLERVPTQGPGRNVVLKTSEAIGLLSQLHGCLYYKVALALYTGLRWGEIHGLAWADIMLDTDQSTLTVRRSFRGVLKTKASAATIPLSAEAADLLRRWRSQQASFGQAGSLWIFPDAHGRLRARPSTAERRAIHEATKHAGIDKHVTPHVFRHTFGTWVYELTGDPKIVQRLMRHASFHTSMLYVHDRRSLAGVVDALPSLVSNTSPAATSSSQETLSVLQQ